MELAVSSSQTKTNEAPAQIANKGPWATNSTNGSFSNICVLGRIFDPIQWVWAVQGSTTTVNGLKRISIPPNATPDSMYGGGNTLRIGKFEHAKFAFTNQSGQLVPNMQQSAAALLDIFCVQDKFIEGEKININTAPPAVLRALAAGVVVGNTNLPTVPRPLMTNSANFVNAFVRGLQIFAPATRFIRPASWLSLGMTGLGQRIGRPMLFLVTRMVSSAPFKGLEKPTMR